MDLSCYKTLGEKRLAVALYLSAVTNSPLSEMQQFASVIENDSTSEQVAYVISVARGFCRLRDDIEKATNFSELGAIERKIKGTSYEPACKRLIELKYHWLLDVEQQPFPLLWGPN